MSPLVTGATGFAGSHLVDHLLEREPVVSAWCNPGGQAPPARADGRVRWQAVNLLDRRAVADAIADLPPSVVYHCAGAADVGAAWAEPRHALEVNVLGTHHVLEGLRTAGIACPVLLTGSATIYRSSAAAIDEAHPVAPASPYGLSKLAQEMLAWHAAGAPVFVARAFNHAGPRQSTAYVTSSFARQIAEIEAGAVEPVIRVGNLDARRDLTDVRDTVRAYRSIVDRGQPARPYNVCSGHAYRIGDLLTTLVGLARIRIEVRVDPARLRPSDTPIVLGNPARVQAETGWTPALPIERTLGDLLDYWRRHR